MLRMAQKLKGTVLVEHLEIAYIEQKTYSVLYSQQGRRKHGAVGAVTFPKINMKFCVVFYLVIPI